MDQAPPGVSYFTPKRKKLGLGLGGRRFTAFEAARAKGPRRGPKGAEGEDEALVEEAEAA